MFCLQVGNLGAPVAEWTVGGTALTSLMDVERRHGILSFFSMFCTALDKIHSLPGLKIQNMMWVRACCIRMLYYGSTLSLKKL